MICELLNILMNILQKNQDNPYFEIYPSFDALPVSGKSKKLFVVISPEIFKLSQAFPDGSSGISPFTADFRIYVLTSMTTPNEKLMEFFYSVIIPQMHSAHCFLYEMQSEAPKVDLKLQKLVYSGIFRLKGLYLPDKQEESAI